MTTAKHLSGWRRVLAVCAASALLHYALIDWGATPPRPVAAQAVTLVAELRSAAPAPVPAAPVPVAGAGVPLPLVQLPGPRRKAAPAPRYRASLPPPAQLSFDVTRSGAGIEGTGQAVMDWRHAESQYRLTMSTVVEGSTLAELASEGAIDASGMVPRTMSAQRRGKARTATHFNARQGRITFSASEGSVPMAPGTQDRASLPMQLAGIARAGAAQLERSIDILVGEEKDASVVRFALVGREEIETPMGRLATWHFLYTPAPGTYRTRLEVWLAPEHEWYPVQLRGTEANGVVTTQTISKIVVNNSAGN